MLLPRRVNNGLGPQNDFGIKYNLANGGPAPESVTNKIYDVSKTLSSYKIASIPDVDISTVGTKTYGELEVEVVDSTADYVEMLKDIFDFELIKKFFATHPDFKVLFDGLSGVTGPYGKAIFQQELGLGSESTQNCEPSPDFNGGHPDPNLTYAHSLVEVVEKNNIPFGAASDGDGDRNMIYGAGAFVSPGDSLAIIAHHAQLIPYFKKNGVFGLARSMPTSGAVDLVAKKQGLNCYEVPTGWKFFCALFDADKLSICGEESFGTGSNHIREKDGLWAIVAWLNIIAGLGVANPGVAPSIKQIQKDFWAEYGRTFFTRYDYEDVDSEGANKVVGILRNLVADPNFVGSKVGGKFLYNCPRQTTSQMLTRDPFLSRPHRHGSWRLLVHRLGRLSLFQPRSVCPLFLGQQDHRSPVRHRFLRRHHPLVHWAAQHGSCYIWYGRPRLPGAWDQDGNGASQVQGVRWPWRAGCEDVSSVLVWVKRTSNGWCS